MPGNIFKKNIKGKEQIPIKKVEPEKKNQDIVKPEETDSSSFFKFSRDFTLYSNAINKLAVDLMGFNRDLVRQEKLLCQRYEKASEERDLAKASDEQLIRRILQLKNDIEENSQKLAEKPLNEILQLLQSDLWAAVEKEGVIKIPVTIGAVYDPLTCIAFYEHINNDVPEGTIVKELTPGYTCRSKKLISAKVSVTKKGEVIKK